jgi:hypothetical protein
VPVFRFPEQLLDELSAALRQMVARAASPHAHPGVRGRMAAPVDGDVRFAASEAASMKWS